VAGVVTVGSRMVLSAPKFKSKEFGVQVRVS
jgi:hypothetical protein